MTQDLVLPPGTDSFAKLNQALFGKIKKDLVVRAYSADYDTLYATLKQSMVPVLHAGLFEAGIEHFMFMGAAIIRGVGYQPAQPAEPKSAWDEQIERELKDGADTWGRIAKKYKK